MQLLRTIAFIVIFYYLFRFLARMFGPMLFRYASKKAQEKYQEQHRNRTQGGGRREMPQEGEVVIENTPENIRKQRTSKSGKKVGEYIDFEEID
ncbi:DUF4834 family protein [Sinomicrobium pectinilyticum]|uniref:DUF4834 family protein n=1 Tax=Sinomicrobium pectinilyticum TaxID=1084421 RepID=A0A3N0DYG7_SINP1|nr:DUF4834 family protein [Sinomicrobium pectinilyticum]RNL80662.1 DUF4834 family protein [Sinomicrobium pectinilyticum]